MSHACFNWEFGTLLFLKFKMAAVEGMLEDEFRANLYTTLQRNGIVDTLKVLFNRKHFIVVIIV